MGTDEGGVFDTVGETVEATETEVLGVLGLLGVFGVFGVNGIYGVSGVDMSSLMLRANLKAVCRSFA
jgi:hypothetical protein